MGEGYLETQPPKETTMSNRSRIEAATRQHVGAVLTSEQIVELVKLSDPTSTKGVYPSDAAYKRTPEGLVHRGKVAYGDGVLEWLAANSFKVLADSEIVRRPGSKVVVPVPPAAPAPTVTEEKKPATDQWVEEQKPKATRKKKRKAA
jgi:hypothetical protein